MKRRRRRRYTVRLLYTRGERRCVYEGLIDVMANGPHQAMRTARRLYRLRHRRVLKVMLYHGR